VAWISAIGLIAVIAIAGWAGAHASAQGNQPQVDTTVTNPAPAPAQVPAAAPASTTTPVTSSCTPWAGLPYLSAVSVDMNELAGDESLYGMGSTQVNSDQLGVTADQAGLMSWQELPAPYAEDVQNDVVSVDPDYASQDQLTTAAANATSLYSSISALCPGS
jgi:hypothetical protein